MKTNLLTYSLKVWLTSVAIAPIAYLVAEFGFRSHDYMSGTDYFKQILVMYTFLIVFGGLLSSPTWLLFYLTVTIIVKLYMVSNQVKYIIMTVGALLTIGTFATLIPFALKPNEEGFPYMIANCICIAGGALFYDLKKDVVQDIEKMTT